MFPHFLLESMPLRGILPSLRVPEDFQNSVLDQKSPQSGVPERRYNCRPTHKTIQAFAQPAKSIVPRGDGHKQRLDDTSPNITHKQPATNIAPQRVVKKIVKAKYRDIEPRTVVFKIVKAKFEDRGPKSKKNPPEAKFAQSISCKEDEFPVPRLAVT